MSGHTIDADTDLFRKKELGAVFSGQPVHGSVAWRKNGDEWEELIYWNKVPEVTSWLIAEEFRQRKYNLKITHIAFFLANPHLLHEKIRRSNPDRLLRRLASRQPYYMD